MGSTLSCKEYSPAVVTKSGPVRGKIYTFDGRKYYGFLGIPYAESPVGALRFKCFWNVSMSEAECLTLNVFCPSDTSNRSRSGYPVMVFIHGGGFSTHSSSLYGNSNIVRNLCSKGVIFVSINYRLGVFGFFTTGDAECPGNMGLWDHAGAHCADLLSVSPHSRDLFHRVIAMSGSSFCPGAILSNEGLSMISRNRARDLGWIGLDNDTKGLMAFMSTQSSEKLLNNLKPTTTSDNCSAPFLPNEDGDFFPTDIVSMRESALKKDYLMGTTACEGLMFDSVVEAPYTIDGLRHSFLLLLKGVEAGVEVEDALIKFYTEGVDHNDKAEMAVISAQLTGDFIVNNRMLLSAMQLTIMGRSVFFYNFEYFSKQNFGLYNYILPYIASTHGFEIRYFLGKGIICKFKPNEDDVKMLDQMTTWLTNFAKYGDPNEPKTKIIWEKHDCSNPFRYFNINYPSSQMSENYQNQRLRKWIEFQIMLDPILAKHRPNLIQDVQGERGNPPARIRLLI